MEPRRVSVRALFLPAAGGTAAVVRRYTQRLIFVVLRRLHRLLERVSFEYEFGIDFFVSCIVDVIVHGYNVSFEYVDMYLFGFGSAPELSFGVEGDGNAWPFLWPPRLSVGQLLTGVLFSDSRPLKAMADMFVKREGLWWTTVGSCLQAPDLRYLQAFSPNNAVLWKRTS